MKSKILSIQFRTNLQALAMERASIVRELADVPVDFVNVWSSEIDWQQPASYMPQYSGVILGGSGEYDFDGNRKEDDPARLASYELLEKLRPLFSYLFEHDIPTLGICYGHQLLGAFAGATVRCDSSQRKTCTHALKFIVDKQEHFLFADIPEDFTAHYGHKDSLDRVPDGAVLLVTGGEQCQFSALQYQKNIYSTQFHPELTIADIILRVGATPGYLPEGALVEEIFNEAPHANKILRNFGKFISR
ncbi:MAG: gamma-glutamyl-gamma-aminobutyrate hydrolase family protein [Candidatus Nomurabacteria bacterium]|nr:MAG: gamma-glutamyl-gamma-aminobutyrate hydrolase family protein [Candidatus Nomurabacteria bacterium]